MKCLSIIIVSFNTKKYIKDCINSILKYIGNIDYEIIVVDNGSTDGSKQYLSKLCKRVKNFYCVNNRENLGFAKANNQGIKKAKGRYILLLNSDIKFKNKFMEEMISWMDKHKDVGVASCALENPDGSLQGSGGYFPTLPKVFAWMFFLEDIPFIELFFKPFHPVHPQSPFYKGRRYFEFSHQQDWVTGAFFLVRKEVLDKVGLLDEEYFMYVEEMEFCFRVKKAGFSVYYLPDWSIIHYGQGSGSSELAILSEYEGLKLFYKKHFSDFQLSILRFLLKVGALLRILVLGILEGGKTARIYAKAFSQA